MTHLGDRVSAFLDGQLPASAVERITAHLAVCRDCRRAVEHQREAKLALRGLGEPVPGPEFLGALAALGGPAGPLPPRPGHVPGTPRPPLVGFAGDLRAAPHLSLAPAGGFAPPGDGEDAPGVRRPVHSLLRPSRRRWGGALLGAATVMGVSVLSATVLPVGGSSSAPLVRTPTGNLVVSPVSTAPSGQRRNGGSPQATPTASTTEVSPWTGSSEASGTVVGYWSIAHPGVWPAR